MENMGLKLSTYFWGKFYFRVNELTHFEKFMNNFLLIKCNKSFSSAENFPNNMYIPDKHGLLIFTHNTTS